MPWAFAALLVAAMAWGSTVVVAKSAFESISPINLLVVRLVLTGVVLVAVFSTRLRMPRAVAVRGMVLGALFTAGIASQIIGLQYTPASLSGFVTASYVVFTAIISAVLLRQRQPATTWLAVGLTIVGIVILASGASRGDAGFGFGAALTLFGAVMFAFHIVLLGRWVRPETVQQLTVMQALMGTAVALVVVPFTGFDMPRDPILWGQLLYLGIFCGAVTLFLQSWAQSYVAATPSAVIMCSEPVFSAIFAIGFGFEPLTVHIIVGGSLVVVALLLTAWPRKRGRVIDALVEEVRRRRSRPA
ncbi:DMT family transporter [Tessaracoccus antarcticus]|uniref:DMT family transporter n=2 Tax=Tessaracoccus antarcticus TaxID=2479848 RepID=A0A3M0G3V7_9ACTN|nr:DMT family transporter [Tessaracoccus antarcticus]